jgi:hypothetical protein
LISYLTGVPGLTILVHRRDITDFKLFSKTGNNIHNTMAYKSIANYRKKPTRAHVATSAAFSEIFPFTVAAAPHLMNED